MAGSLQGLPNFPTFGLQPSATRVALSTNYITNFDFLNQYLPDTYEKEFERYGNRSVSSFLRMVGAEMPCESDLIKWAEQGRLHIKYTQVGTAAAAGEDNPVFQVNDDLAAPGGIPAGVVTDKNISTTVGVAGDGGLGVGQIAIRLGQTVLVSFNNGAGINKGLVTAVDLALGQFTLALYEGAGLVAAGAGLPESDVTIFVYGSEFAKGTEGMDGSLEGDSVIFENKPIILKDKYQVTGSDMTQIGWIEVSTENGATGYLWYLKSEHETRLRFDDYLETAMIEAVPAGAGSGALAAGLTGSEGIFDAVQTRGNVWAGGIPTQLSDFDTIITRLDNQGAIEENVLFVSRDMGFAIDDMLSTLNSYGLGGSSYGLFDNDEQMALNLGFSGFRRGYDFYKTDWKYLNDPTMRGGLAAGAGSVNGLLVPAGTTTVYDQILGKNAKRPFLHVRYRASQSEDRRYKTWMTGSAGGAMTSDLDAMEVHFLSERAVCVMGANNFVIFED